MQSRIELDVSLLVYRPSAISSGSVTSLRAVGADDQVMHHLGELISFIRSLTAAERNQIFVTAHAVRNFVVPKASVEESDDNIRA